jgi:hypothetical protein
MVCVYVCVYVWLTQIFYQEYHGLGALKAVMFALGVGVSSVIPPCPIIMSDQILLILPDHSVRQFCETVPPGRFCNLSHHHVSRFRLSILFEESEAESAVEGQCACQTGQTSASRHSLSDDCPTEV